MIETWTPKRALFIYAHPDDVDFSAAGTAAKWARNGSELTYVIMTDGNAGSHDPDMSKERLGQIRRAEQRAAAAVVGVSSCIFIGCQDGLLTPTLQLRKRLVRIIREIRPEAVVCGDPRRYFSGDTYINHPDHRAAAHLALDAVFPAAEMNLLYPDMLEEGLHGHKVNHVYISTRDDPDCYVDIGNTVNLKIEALRQHASQMNGWDPGPPIRERQAVLGAEAGCEYAEAFRRMVLKPIEEDAT